MKSRTAETIAKTEEINNEIRNANQRICERKVIIHTKERQNKILQQKFVLIFIFWLVFLQNFIAIIIFRVQEWYAHQKYICSEMDDIDTTLASCKDLTSEMNNIYKKVTDQQVSDLQELQGKLQNVTADPKCLLPIDF